MARFTPLYISLVRFYHHSSAFFNTSSCIGIHGTANARASVAHGPWCRKFNDEEQSRARCTCKTEINMEAVAGAPRSY